MAAGHRSSPAGQQAFSKLCEKYWYPLYAHVRRQENDAHRARDLTQGFFERVIEKNYVADADPGRGRFRTFLLASLTHFIANETEKANAVKRGGGRSHVSLAFDEGERRFQREPADNSPPDELFEKRWAVALLKQVLDQLRREYDAADRAGLFEMLEPFLTMDKTEKYSAVAARVDMTEGAVKTAVHRIRSRYREVLRQEIADTLADPGDVEDEIYRLFQTFSA